MADLPSSFLNYINRRGYNTFDKPEETLRHRKPWSYKQYQESLQNLIETGEEETIFGADTAVTSTVTPAVVPTIGGAAAGTSTSVTGGLIGGGIAAGTILGSVFGSIVTSDSNKHKNPAISLPEHKYLGPGNSIDTGVAPVDKDDARAQFHDEQYQEAKSDQDILNADKTFIVDSVPDVIKGDPHSIISTGIITGKHIIENVLGVQYSGT